MATKQQRGRGAGQPPAPHAQTEVQPDEIIAEKTTEEDTTTMSAYAMQPQQPARAGEGITVIGEAVRAVPPEAADFMIEITAGAPGAAQALREVNARVAQVVQAASALGVQQSDVQSIALNVANAWGPAVPPLGQSWANLTQAYGPPAYGPMIQPTAGYAGLPQALSGAFGAHAAQSGFGAFAPGAPLQADVQFGQYAARNTLRVSVREPNRVGEVADAMARAGANIVGAFHFRVQDEPQARRATLESAAKDARSKAEAVASATGKQVGDPIAIAEEVVASNGQYAAGGQLEYYARVSATYRLQ